MVNCPDCGNPQDDKSGNCGSVQLKKTRKFSKLSLTGFMISLATLVCLIVFRETVIDKFYNIVLIVAAVSMTVSLILSIIGIVSSKKNNKKGRPFGFGGLIISASALFVYLAYAVLLGLLLGILSALNSCSPNTNTARTTETTMNPRTAVISGIPRIFGKEITLPCTVGELKELGFDTDYDVTVHEIHMWPRDGRELFVHGPYFDCYLEYDSYNSRSNKATDASVVVAIQFQEHNRVELDFHNISIDMTEDDILSVFGVPAYQEDDRMNGHKSYYSGENGCMYRFNYYYSNERYSIEEEDRSIWKIMYATEDFMRERAKYN